jgi:probable HAF family extracellular repeat protein
MNFRYSNLDDPNVNSVFGTWPFGINNYGEVVGQFFQGGGYLPFSELGGVFTTLPEPLGGDRASASGVNDLGQIVGNFRNASLGSSGFLYSGGTFTQLDDPNAKMPGATVVSGINDSGVIVGHYFDNGNVVHGFKYVGGVYTTIDVPGAILTEAIGINAAGVIVGAYEDSGFVMHGFIDNNSSFTTLDDPLAGSFGTLATGINDLGQVVGTYTDTMVRNHGFLYSNSSFTTIDDPSVAYPGVNTGTSANSINDAGRIVGYYTDSSSYHGFVLNTKAAPHDLNGDYAADVVWRNTNGTVAGWLMNGASISSGANLTYQGNPIAPDVSWSVAGTADFNGDGNADLLWRQSSGGLALWSMNGQSVTSSAPITYQGSQLAPDASWSIAGTADFNGDGNADLLWRQSSGALAMWSMNGATVGSSAPVTYQGNQLAPDASWSVAGVGDFNGDGGADLVWRQSSGALSLWSMNGNAVSASSAITSQGNAVAPDASWSIAGVGDFNGDGHADLLWRQNTGAVAIWLMNGSSIGSSAAITYQGNAVAPDSSWSVVEIGDFLGTGGSDILWRQSTTGALSEWLMNGPQIVSTSTLSASPDASWQVQGKTTNFA